MSESLYCHRKSLPCNRPSTANPYYLLGATVCKLFYLELLSIWLKCGKVEYNCLLSIDLYKSIEIWQWFCPDTPVSSTNKTDRHDITEIFVECGVKHHNPNTTNKNKSVEYINSIVHTTRFWKKNIIRYKKGKQNNRNKNMANIAMGLCQKDLSEDFLVLGN